MMWIKCYVCNTATGDWGNNLAGLKSQHSNVLVTDLLKKVLNGFQSMRNIENQWNCVCIDCLNKIENYDWNRLRAEQAEQELYNILVQTENGLKIDSKPVLIEGAASSSNLRTENDATVDTQSFIEPEMISVNEMFDVKMETHMSYEEIDETNEELLVPTIGTPLQVCNPIDVDESIGVPESGLGVNVKRSVGRLRGSSEINYDCNECGMVFERRDDLRAHNKHVHGRTPGQPKKNPAIGLKFKRSVGRPRGSSEINYGCNECGMVFERREDLRAHNKHVHKRTPGRPRKFPAIELKFKRSVGRPKKMEAVVVYGVTSDVDSSSIQLKSTNALQTEDADESETNTVKESHDDRLADKVEPDVNEGSLSDPRGDNIVQSDEDFVYSEEKIDKHKADHTKVKRKVGRPGRYVETKFECIDCELVFEAAKLLNAHKAWHREQDFPKFKCKKCFYISDGQEMFDAHDKLHDNVPPLKCVYCDYNAPTKTRLNLHTVKHITVKQFICSICAMQFVRRNIFNTHMNYHLNIRKYSCPKCNMTFIEKKNLNRHLKTHSGIKPYSCKICNRRFAHSYNVRNHERTHTERDVYRKFKCNIEGCKSGFDSKTKLNRHLQKNHSMTPHSAISIDLNESVPKATGRWAQRNMITENHPDPEFTNTYNDKNQMLS